MEAYEKITPYNGFYQDPNQGQQNNYAWSMAEMDDYIYVGTGRNIVYSVLALNFNIPPSEIPDVFIPKPQPDMSAEIWRYKKDGSLPWEQVFKAKPQDGIVGFRFMIRYTSKSGKTALYAGAFSNNVKILMSENGTAWNFLNTGIATGNNTRTMLEHNGKLYLGVMSSLGGGIQTLLYETDEPTQLWTQVESGDINKNPRGEIASMTSFDGHLYIGTAPPGGFEVWRTNGSFPVKDDWKLVVDKGAGEALNELPLSMRVFNNHVFVGTGIWFGISSIDPSKKFVPPKGFDLIRICANDKWEVIIGNEPISPTEPTTNGTRNPKLPAGLGDLSNAYCWQLTEYDQKLFIGTWDWSVLLPTALLNFIKDFKGFVPTATALDQVMKNPKTDSEYNYLPLIKSIIESLPSMLTTMGGDIWVSCNGCDWNPVSLNGLGNPHNYGIRNLFSSENGRLYIGTANPYDGCEVWVSKPDRKPHRCRRRCKKR